MQAAWFTAKVRYAGSRGMYFPLAAWRRARGFPERQRAVPVTACIKVVRSPDVRGARVRLGIAVDGTVVGVPRRGQTLIREATKGDCK